MNKHEFFDDQWIIVTGGAGFIGSCIVRQLNNLGYGKNVVVVDDFKESIKWKNLYEKRYSEFLSRFELMHWLKGREKEVGAILHMGANSATTGKDGDEYYRLNYRYSVDLAKFAIEHGIRFVYASSAATYGSGSRGFSDDIDLIGSLRPMNLYGQSKQMFDMWVLQNDFLNRVVGLKFFNVYGPGEYHKARMASMVFHMYNQIQKEGRVRLFRSNTTEYKDGGQERDFIYVKDVAKIATDFLFNDICGIFNVGTGIARSWNSMAQIIFNALGKPLEIEYIPMPEDISKSYQNYTCADMSKLESLMELPNTSLEEGVFDYVRNYLIDEERW